MYVLARSLVFFFFCLIPGRYYILGNCELIEPVFIICGSRTECYFSTAALYGKVDHDINDVSVSFCSLISTVYLWNPQDYSAVCLSLYRPLVMEPFYFHFSLSWSPWSTSQSTVCSVTRPWTPPIWLSSTRSRGWLLTMASLGETSWGSFMPSSRNLVSPHSNDIKYYHSIT